MRRAFVHGFTLLELLSVIAITSILAATAVPRLASTNTFNTRADTGALASALRYAQKTAVAQHRPVFFVLSTLTRTIRLCYDNACGTFVMDPVTQTGFNQTLSNAVVLNAVNSTVGFDPLGRPTDSAGNLLVANAIFTVQNATQTSQSTSLIVEAETGYVH